MCFLDPIHLRISGIDKIIQIFADSIIRCHDHTHADPDLLFCQILCDLCAA